MLDIVGAIFAAAVFTTVVGILVGLSAARPRDKLIVYGIGAAWGTAVVVLAALGGFAPGATGPVPAPALAFVASLALLFGAWAVLPRFRSALLGLPLSVLVGVNVARLGGITFLLLAADGRLSAPFAPVAGGGDMLVAALAIPVAALATRGERRPVLLAAWNALGALDLVVAVALGVLSAPGTPFRVFTDGSGTTAMTTLPWIFVPVLLVPMFLLVHFTIAVRLRASRAVPLGLTQAHQVG